MEEVIRYITRHRREPGDSIMFDIDDTLIDSRTHKTVPHIKNLLDLCKQIGYNIVIITARPGDPYSQEYTEEQLEAHGIKYDLLAYCVPESKTYVKRHLTDTRNWNFVLSVGDQPTDLTDSDIYLLVQKPNFHA